MKGQISIYVLLGVLILLLVGATAYYVRQTRVIPVEEQVVVPPNARPVYDVITGCMKQSALQAVQLLGLQGGYVDVPPPIKSQPLGIIRLDPYNQFVVPYWYYQDKPRIPSLNEMARQISNAVKKSMSKCADLSSMGNVRQLTNISVTTTIDKDIIIVADWKLLVVEQDRSTPLNKFAVSIQVPLKEVYDTAVAIYQAESQGLFFANLTLDLMSINPDIPMAGMELSCQKKRWNTNQVKEELQEMMKNNLQFVRVKNTKTRPFEKNDNVYKQLRKDASVLQDMLIDESISDTVNDFNDPRQPSNIRNLGERLKNAPEDAYEYFNMQLDANLPKTDLRVNIEYQPEWGMLFDVLPRDGKRMVSSKTRIASVIRFLCFNQYHFTYDLTYPVMIRVISEQALRGKGFTFEYALPVSVDDNQAVRRDTTLHLFEGITDVVEFCDKPGQQTADIRVVGAIEGISRLVELKGANITYTCLNRECDLGKTSADEGGYRLLTKLPQACTHPFITAQHDGYLTQTKQFKQKSITIPLKKLKTLPVTFKKHTIGIDNHLGTAQPLEPFEKATVALIMKGEDHDQYIESINDEQLAKSLVFLESLPLDDPRRAQIANTRKLLKGIPMDFVEQDQQYELNIYLRDDFGNIIGGYFNDNLTISGKDVRNARAVEFHVFRYTPTPQTDEEKTIMATILYEGEHNKELQPIFT